VVYGLSCYFVVALLAWVLIFLNGLEIFFSLFSVSVEGWHITTFLADVRHQAALLHAIGGDFIDPLYSENVGEHQYEHVAGYIPFVNFDVNFIQVPTVLLFSYNISFLISCFITVSIFFGLLLARQGLLVFTALLYLILLVCVSVLFIFTTSLFVMFICFECLLLVAIGLLKLTSKSERIGEAVSEMFMWTLFGSFFLLLGFFSIYAEMSTFLESSLSPEPASPVICLFFIIGFGVKIPVWPFFSWLLKAHVEASVEFSILLSGFIVKLGILGLWRILDIFGCD
jgi:formate hydrogenlyase subunit 3/multisubunit Na+/H+ antiporter MnhD subunit